jgi:hypothetical protein
MPPIHSLEYIAKKIENKNKQIHPNVQRINLWTRSLKKVAQIISNNLKQSAFFPTNNNTMNIKPKTL